MTIKFGIIMDPISTINIKKDSTFAILLQAQKRNYQIYYMEINDLILHNNKSYATTKRLFLKKNNLNWFNFGPEINIPLSFLDVIFIRKDPPFDEKYAYVTHILEFAEKEKTLVINKPSSLRDFNEKIFACHFPKLIPPTLVTNKISKIQEFLKKYKDIIIKPLNKMGGQSIFRIQNNDVNCSVIMEIMTKNNTSYCMIQSYLPDIIYGDKRILIIHGTSIPYSLARIPQGKETRGNLAVGGMAKPQLLDKSDQKICDTISYFLKEKGLSFVGIDVIGNKLTEINITSPTGICEIEKKFPISITTIFLKGVEHLLKNKKYC